MGTRLVLRSLWLLGEAGGRGGWIGLEHPKDPEKAPFPSIFSSTEAKITKSRANAFEIVFNQCRFGAVSRKPTQFMLNDPKLKPVFHLCCNHIAGTHKTLLV